MRHKVGWGTRESADRPWDVLGHGAVTAAVVTRRGSTCVELVLGEVLPDLGEAVEVGQRRAVGQAHAVLQRYESGILRAETWKEVERNEWKG